MTKHFYRIPHQFHTEKVFNFYQIYRLMMNSFSVLSNTKIGNLTIHTLKKIMETTVMHLRDVLPIPEANQLERQC